MIDLATYLAFIVTAGATVITPGPDTILILRNAISSGRSTGLATVLGVQLGLVGHTLLAVFGISVMIAASPVLFKTVAVAGAAYLAWIGLQGFRGQTLKFDAATRPVSHKRAMVDAIFCNLLNPKVIILFLALLPNFVDPAQGDASVQLVILAVSLLVINTIWQVPFAWAADKVRQWLMRPKVQKTFNRSTGVCLIFFALLMLWEHLLK